VTHRWVSPLAAAFGRAWRHPATVVCRLCGRSAWQWTSVIWADHRTCAFRIQITAADTVADLCRYCANKIVEDVYGAVRIVIDYHRDKRNNNPNEQAR
jgi:hypothetical protein